MKKQKSNCAKARPFLKWAGGKTQLLPEFTKRLPNEINAGSITKFIEPFIGGGAFFFYITRNFSFDKCYICDINEELVLSYKTVQQAVQELAEELEIFEAEFLSSNDHQKEEYYYDVRDAFNKDLPAIDFSKYGPEWIRRTAQIIFLNHTCYNGLFRVNRRGEFNVPFGRYKNPEILNKENLCMVSQILNNTRIVTGDFTKTRRYADEDTFVYLDPPYRPLNTTSSFTSYSKSGFSDLDQKRLAKFFRDLDARGAKVMLSNSDPRNHDPEDAFFDDLYSGYTIERIPAKRMINCNGSLRGKVSELVITNY